MAHKLVVLEWLYRADQDIGFVKVNLHSNEISYFDPLCFFSQQAAEKYLKAYIIKNNLLFTKIHDLLKLLNICIKHDNSFSSISENCGYLNSFYIETRYGDKIFAISTREQAENALSHAQIIKQFIKDKLGIRKEITLEEIKTEHKKIDKILKKEDS